jgi:hypothetical protein
MYQAWHGPGNPGNEMPGMRFFEKISWQSWQQDFL